MKIQVMLKKDANGYTVLSGQMRLKVALSVRDEVVVESPGVGAVLIAKLPDGGLVATQDGNTMALLGL